MSGTRLHSWREGDRSEYFAQVLLSGLGLSTPIPRQEDIGYDFSCNIADQEGGILSFGYPFLISIKSLSNPNLDLVPSPRAKRENDQRHVDWLFRQEIPSFLGVVDKDAFSLRIFSLNPLWFIYYEGGTKCGELHIKPRIQDDDARDVGRPLDVGEIDDWSGMRSYDVDLGHPIAILDLESLKNLEALSSIKDRLRIAWRFAQLNHLHFHLKVPYFYWFAKTYPDDRQFIPAFFCLPVPEEPEAIQEVTRELAPSLICLALHYKEAGDFEAISAVKQLLKPLPEAYFPEVLRAELADIITRC